MPLVADFPVVGRPWVQKGCLGFVFHGMPTGEVYHGKGGAYPFYEHRCPVTDEVTAPSGRSAKKKKTRASTTPGATGARAAMKRLTGEVLRLPFDPKHAGGDGLILKEDVDAEREHFKRRKIPGNQRTAPHPYLRTVRPGARRGPGLVCSQVRGCQTAAMWGRSYRRWRAGKAFALARICIAVLKMLRAAFFSPDGFPRSQLSREGGPGRKAAKVVSDHIRSIVRPGVSPEILGLSRYSMQARRGEEEKRPGSALLSSKTRPAQIGWRFGPHIIGGGITKKKATPATAMPMKAKPIPDLPQDLESCLICAEVPRMGGRSDVHE
eukprot:g8327.t1